MKINKMVTRIILFSLVTGSIMYATGLVQSNHTLSQTTYQDMTMIELQEEVEKLSENGDIPFDLGLELINRWTQRS